MRRPLHPQLLVLAQRGDRIVAQTAPQHDCVLDRLPRSLAHVERHRVGCVAEKRHAPLAPPFVGLAVVQVAPMCPLGRCRRDHLFDRLRPPLEALEEHRHALLGRLAPSFGCVRDREPVHALLVDVVAGKAQARAVVEEEITDRRALMGERRDALPDRVAGVDRRRRPEQLRSHGRIRAVGADEGRAFRSRRRTSQSRRPRPGGSL